MPRIAAFAVILFYCGQLEGKFILDSIDKRILRVLQRNAALSTSELASEVGLSATPCWKRVKRLEASGLIRDRVALIDREKVELATTVFVAVRANRHDQAWLDAFAEGVAEIPEVMEFYRMSGQTDYLLKIVCKDIADYDRIYKKLIKTAPMHDVSSSFAMEQIKYTTELPI